MTNLIWRGLTGITLDRASKWIIPIAALYFGGHLVVALYRGVL